MELEPPDFGRLRLAFRDDAHGDVVRALERERARGELQALRPGVLRPVPLPLAELAADERYHEGRRRFLDLVTAVGITRRSEPVMFSHRTALAILGLPTVGGWPQAVDLLESTTNSRRSKRGVRIHRMDYSPDEVMPWGPFFVTTPARTIADVARSGDFEATVVGLDFAMSKAAPSLLRLSTSDVMDVLSRHGERGLVRAETAVRFADGRAANAGESVSRVAIYQLGYEIPELQVRHSHSGGHFDVDFK